MLFFEFKYWINKSERRENVWSVNCNFASHSYLSNCQRLTILKKKKKIETEIQILPNLLVFLYISIQKIKNTQKKKDREN